MLIPAFSDQTTSFPLRRNHPWAARTARLKARSPAPPGPLAPHPQRPAPRALRRALRGEAAPPPPAPRGAGQAPSPPLPAGTCGHGPSHIPAGSGEPRGDGGGGGRSGRREGPVPVRSSAMRGRDETGREGPAAAAQGEARRCPGPVRPLRSAVPAAAAGRGEARPRAPPAAGHIPLPAAPPLPGWRHPPGRCRLPAGSRTPLRSPCSRDKSFPRPTPGRRPCQRPRCAGFILTENRTITEWFGSEGDLEDHPVSTHPAVDRDTFD